MRGKENGTDKWQGSNFRQIYNYVLCKEREESLDIEKDIVTYMHKKEYIIEILI